MSINSTVTGSSNNDAVNDAVKKDQIHPISDTVIDALSDTVKIIASDPEGVSMNDIMKGTGKSSATVKRYLQTLKQLNFITFRGAAKTGKYIIIQQQPNKLNNRNNLE